MSSNNVTPMQSTRAAIDTARSLHVLGALASSVAHGINTPLTQVFGNASLATELARELLRDLDDRWAKGDIASVRRAVRSLAESATLAHEGATAIASITRSMGLFNLDAGPDGADAAVALARVLDAVIDLSENVIRHRASLVCEIGVLPSVHGSDALVGHLLLAALLGSAQRMPEGDARRHEVRVRATAAPGGALVEITGTGEAEPTPGEAPRLSDLTLAHCRALAAELGARVEVDPVPAGLRVAVWLPAAAADARPSSVPSPPIADAAPERHEDAARGRVLVVDDEPVLLKLMCRIVGFDHDVEGTTDPHEALARVERGERYDVILCDLMMPSMSGADLHAAIARFAPHVARRMVFLTAGAFTEKARGFLHSGQVTWFEKPVEPEHLRRVVSARVAAARA